MSRPRGATSIDEFDDIIDVRSPSEYAEDHIPGALNCPVLDDGERALVGTTYKQVSSFDAKVMGAALVSRNIAKHIEQCFAQKKRNWRPLVYCWRGGNRSEAMTHVLQKVGWSARALDGGYRAYRRAVLAELAELPQRFRYVVACGPTGSGKSRVLKAMAQAGGQVLDLEELAAHRGSVLGDLPGQPQPTQKYFDSLLWDTLRRFNPKRPVFVEAESKRIGLVQAPESLISQMWQSDCVLIDTPLASRVELLKNEYPHFAEDFAVLSKQLKRLTALHGRERIESWLTLAQGDEWNTLVTRLLVEHYDPAYNRSTLSHFKRLENAKVVSGDPTEPKSLNAMVSEILLHFDQDT